ncbi:MAG: helix-turn-helix transcriptional regulator [Oscillospiraceae bacterium]|nr:helix-turn-helix transcriptional regulator [Oscillospiraceae bacterium]
MEEKLTVFGNRLKMLRKENKQKQKEMAELLGIAERNYQRLEYGETNVPATTLIFLCNHFHVSADFLLGRTDNRDVNL